ncbi:MAG: MerR family transcriptional regulator [Thermodesulfobacteriota bacterium]
MPLDNSEPIYPISVASKLLSLHPRTLRIYEEEGLIKPARFGNKRYFSNNDIEWIKCLRSLIHERGISIPGIKMLLELTPCWEITKCPAEKRERCSAYIDRSVPCWQRASNACAKELEQCENCEVYIKAMQKAKELADSGEGSPCAKMASNLG